MAFTFQQPAHAAPKMPNADHSGSHAADEAKPGGDNLTARQGAPD